MASDTATGSTGGTSVVVSVVLSFLAELAEPDELSLDDVDLHDTIDSNISAMSIIFILFPILNYDLPNNSSVEQCRASANWIKTSTDGLLVLLINFDKCAFLSPEILQNWV